jgi:hypothetical protein
MRKISSIEWLGRWRRKMKGLKNKLITMIIMLKGSRIKLDSKKEDLDKCRE